jgi:hypothetical protein
MKNFFDNSFIDIFNEIALTQEDIEQFEKYKKEYMDKPEKYIIREIVQIKNTLSKEVLQQHIYNLNLLSQMKGFVSEEHKNKIEYIKNLLDSDIFVGRRRYERTPDVEEQYFGRSSLLLWFLLLTAIWRRPYVY